MACSTVRVPSCSRASCAAVLSATVACGEKSWGTRMRRKIEAAIGHLRDAQSAAPRFVPHARGRQALTHPCASTIARHTGMRFLLNWIISALSLLVVGRLIPGFTVDGLEPARLAAAVLGLITATLGVVLSLLTLPLTIVTFGLFHFVVMAFLIWLATAGVAR